MAQEDLKNGKVLNPANSDITKELERIEKETVLASRTPETTKTQTVKKNTTKNQKSNTSKTQNTGVVKKESPAVVPTVQKSTTVPASEVATNTTSNAVVQTPAVAKPTLADLYKDEKRYALVIGNSAYAKQIGELKN